MRKKMSKRNKKIQTLRPWITIVLEYVCVDYPVIDLVPISNKNRVIISWVWEWDRNPWPTKDFDGPKATSCLVEIKRWEVVEASNLIFDLKCVGEVLAWRDGACCPINSILIRISPLLNTIPVAFQNKSPRQCKD